MDGKCDASNSDKGWFYHENLIDIEALKNR
jgi:hypothetical protein